ncbi:cytochrome c1 [Sphingomicrobium aestuariivivum]|uniref:cytochrome c1 n=1 Tax=Sphingomicrobium aestuariivivum TaxID=1582356 RepID=UPI001FD63B54|nr:cytochrome c1 [Sphingomicrobium aestuariivivum]MCJ8190208.1 cytochrome c1 [Sphingomicrobium aestuariivivum]
MGQLLKFIGIRGFAFFVGLGFLFVLLWSFVTDAINYFEEPPVKGAEYALVKENKDVDFAFEGAFGRYDQAQLQRGFAVFQNVCASCHGMQYVAFRNLEDLGYTPEQVKAFAANWPIEVPTINPDTGEDATRPALPADRFPNPYANEVAARAANNNAYPPDMSLIAKARPDGANYIYSLLTGYQEPYQGYEESAEELAEKYPEAQPGEGLYHNPWFPNLNIAMPAPITADGQVEYPEGAPEATVEQMSADVAAFLMWAAEPKADTRKNAGLAVLIFLAFATVFAYMSYRQIWAEAKRKVALKGPLDPEHMAEREAAKAEAAEHGRGVKG